MLFQQSLVGDIVLFRGLIVLAILLAPTFVSAQALIHIDSDDVEFQSSGLVGGITAGNINKPGNKRLCGFVINGNHRSRANPHVEWDLNIDQIVTPGLTVAGVSAGTFDVTDHKRKPRTPITQLSFTLHEQDPVEAEISGTPNAANGIVALIQPEPAKRLFAEFQTERPIIISLHYADQSAEQLEVRGFRDRRMFGSAHNTYFEECLQGFRAF